MISIELVCFLIKDHHRIEKQKSRESYTLPMSLFMNLNNISFSSQLFVLDTNMRLNGEKNVYVFCFSVFPPTKVDHSNLTLSSLEVQKKSQCLKLRSDNIICIQKSKISMKTPHLIYCMTICFPLYFLKGIIGELCLISQVNFHNLWKSNIWAFFLGACSERIWKPGHQLKRVKESKQGFKMKSLMTRMVE